MSWLQIAGAAALIAVGPAFLVWLIILLTSDPDEGANIGGGLIGLAVLAISIVVATVFVAWHIIRALRSR